MKNTNVKTIDRNKICIRMLLWGGLAFLALLILRSLLLPVCADELKRKELSIPFVKDYMEANFAFDFSDDQPHHIEITAPNGAVVQKDSDAAQVIMSVKDVTAGTYSIVITAEGEIKVSASVECVSAIVTEHTEAISVTSVISGLRIYFIDGDVCVEWDDTGLGKIDIKVSNPASMQTLDSKTVNGTFYRYKLPDGIEEVEVYAVPASEAKIDGAGITYTVPVVKGIAASLEVPDVSLVNTETISVIGHFDIPIEVTVTDNGDYIYNQKFDEGEAKIDIPLSGVNNDLVVYLKDIATYNQITYSFSVTRDLVAPSLTFKESYNDMKVSADTIHIQGLMKNGSSLFLNNETVPFETDGNFDLVVNLNIGKNQFAVCAEDAAGNQSTSILVIERTQKRGLNLKGLLILLIPALIIVFLVVAVIVKKTGTKKETSFIEKVEKEDAEKLTAEVKEDADVESVKKELQKIKQRRSAQGLYLGAVPVFLVIALFTGLLLSQKLVLTQNLTSSMDPTIKPGEVLIFTKFLLPNNTPQRGDIVMFPSEHYEEGENKLLLKRVIGIAGDEITFENGDVYINGLQAIESYLQEDVETNCSKTFVVPEGCVFVMGDNREYSIDSRMFVDPYVRISDIKGKYAGGIYLPFFANIRFFHH